jgi:hypothetical protein
VVRIDLARELGSSFCQEVSEGSYEPGELYLRREGDDGTVLRGLVRHGNMTSTVFCAYHDGAMVRFVS